MPRRAHSMHNWRIPLSHADLAVRILLLNVFLRRETDANGRDPCKSRRTDGYSPRRVNSSRANSRRAKSGERSEEARRAPKSQARRCKKDRSRKAQSGKGGKTQIGRDGEAQDRKSTRLNCSRLG